MVKPITAPPAKSARVACVLGGRAFASTNSLAGQSIASSAARLGSFQGGGLRSNSGSFAMLAAIRRAFRV